MRPGVLLVALLALPARAQEGNVPPRLQTSLTARTDIAVRFHAPHRATKLRQYVYLRGAYALGDGETGPALRFALRAHDDRASGESELDLREAVAAFSAGGWDLRVGRQQVVWGEAVGLFFADVVNPKDLREFLLRPFDDIRIPLWSVDALRSLGGDRVLEIFWSPEVRFSKLPGAGAEFAPYQPPPPPGVNVVHTPTPKPASTLANSSVGVRYSWLRNGWDAAIFYHRAFDDLPAVSRQLTVIDGAPTVSVSLLHPRVHRFGLTASKPFGDGVWKAEAVYTTGKRFEAKEPVSALRRDELTAMVGATYPLSRYNLDVQLFDRAIVGNAQPLREQATRTGLSLRLADDVSLRRVRPAALLVIGLSQKDIWLSPTVEYRLGDASTLTIGLDWFAGPRDTLLGQFRRVSRVQAMMTRRF